jgi:hypothetical protein
VIDSAKVADLPLLGCKSVHTGRGLERRPASRSKRPFDNCGMDNLRIDGGPLRKWAAAR